MIRTTKRDIDSVAAPADRRVETDQAVHAPSGLRSETIRSRVHRFFLRRRSKSEMKRQD